MIGEIQGFNLVPYMPYFIRLKLQKIMIFTYIIFSMQRAFCAKVGQKMVVYLLIINLERHVMHQNVCLSVCYHLEVLYKKLISFILLKIDICSCITFFFFFKYSIAPNLDIRLVVYNV